MSGKSEKTVKTRCPICGAKYRVPVKSVGHRARCAKCKTVFRVPKPKFEPARARQSGPPSEDDIMRWLNDASEERSAPRPRVVSGGTKHDMPTPAETDPQADPVPAQAPESPAPAEHAAPPAPRETGHRGRPDEAESAPPPIRPTPPVTTFEDRYSGPDALLADDPNLFRKTG